MMISIKKIYTFLIIFFPILSIYRSPIASIDMGTFLICITGVAIALNKKWVIELQRKLLPLILYVVIITSISIFSVSLYAPSTTVLTRMLRFVILLGIFSFCNKDYFDFDYGVHLLQKVTVIASVYLIIQFLVYNASGYILPNFIPGLTKAQGLTQSNVLSEYANFYRPTSFFLEPSSFVYFAALMLVCSLFLQEYVEIWNKNVTAILITVAIIFSTSGQGFIVVAVTWGCWFLKLLIQRSINRIKIIKIIGVFVLMLIIVPIIMRSEIVENTLGRILVEDPNEMSAIDARSGGYDMFKNLSSFRKIVGMGFGNLPDNMYFSSIADILFTLGIIGLLIVLVLYLKLFIHGRLFQKMLCVVSMILMFGGGLFTATYLLFYLSFIVFHRFAKENYKKEDRGRVV